MTSSVVDTLSVETTESLGFKFLFSKQIVPGFNEDLPFSKLSNASIHPLKKLLAVASSKTVSVYDLQSVRDEAFITLNTKEFTTKVVGVFFVTESLATVLEDGSVWVNKLDQFTWEQYWDGNGVNEVICSAIFQGNVLLASNANAVFKISLSQKHSSEQLHSITGCVAIDTLKHQLYVLRRNGSIDVLDEQFNVTSSIEKPSLDEPNEPLSINTLSESSLLVSYGEPVDASEKDIMYDLTLYFVDVNTKSFTPSMDIAPPYSTVKRNPSYYSQTLYQLAQQLPHLFVIGSSCASELSIATPNVMYKPDQDAACAILPINPETDNDTQPIGMALDLFSSGTVYEPCSGVESADNLPILYILTNLGELFCWALFHHSALQNSSFTLEPTKTQYVQSFEILSHKTESGSSSMEKEKVTLVSPQDAKNTITETRKDPEQSSFFGTTKSFAKGFSFTPKNTTDNTNAESVGSQSPLLSSGSSPAFGKPAFGQATFGQVTSSQAAPGQSAFGQPAFGQSAFGKPAFGEPAFGKPASSQPTHGQSAFGQPAFGQLTFGKPASSQPTSGQSAFGQSASSIPAFGKPTFGSTSFGTQSQTNTTSPLSEEAGTSSAFGTPSFGSTSFGIQGANVTSPFGTNTKISSDSSFGKSLFGTSQYGSDSAVTNPAPNSFATSAKLSSPFSAFATDQKIINPFETQTSDPFGHLKSKKEDNKSFNFTGFDESISKANQTLSSATQDSLNSKEVSDSTIENDQSETPSPAKDSSISEDQDGIESNIVSSTDESDSVYGEDSEIYDNDRSDIHIEASSKPSSTVLNSNSDIEDDEDEQSNEEQAKVETKDGENEEGEEQEEEQEEEKEQQTHDEEQVKDDTEDVPEEKNQEEDEGNDKQVKENLHAEGSFPSVESTTPVATSYVTEKDDTRSSVASFTDRIKKAANISTENIANPFMKSTAVESKDSSPFSGFTNSLSKDTGKAPAFSFANLKKDGSEITSPLSGVNSNSNESVMREPEPELKQKTSDELDPEALTSSANIPSSEEKKEAPLKDQKVVPSKTVSPDSGSISSSPVVVDYPPVRMNKSSGTTTKEYVSQHVQATVPVGSASTQSVTKESADFALQTFENDEQYIAERYLPDMPSTFYSTAELTEFSTISSDEVVRAVEKTNAQVLANIQVLRSNIDNIGKFIGDHSQDLFKRTEKTVSIVSSWRLDEAATLLDILTSKAKQSHGLKQSYQKLADSSSAVTDFDMLITTLKRQYDILELSNRTSNHSNRKLSWSQHHISTKVKRKLEEASSKLDKIRESIQVLKLYNLTNTKEALHTVQQLSLNGGIGRENLLTEIQSLREEISGLKLSAEKVNQLEPENLLISTAPTSLPLLETTLELHARAHLGDFFSSKLST
ncbi:Nup159 [Kluyveromyces lactis]|nr:Nup159 [Kluyveromyces lactis]